MQNAKRTEKDKKRQSKKKWTRKEKIAVFGVVTAVIIPVVIAIVSKRIKKAEVEIDQIKGDGAVVGNHVTVTIDKRKGIDLDSFLAKAIEASEAKGRLEAYNEQIKEQLRKALERINRLQAEKESEDAVIALQELLERGDMTRLQELLIEERNKHRDRLIERNHEIAAVAYFRGDTQTALAVSDEVLNIDPNDLISLNLRGASFGSQSKFTEAKVDFVRIVNLTTNPGEELWQAGGYCNLGVLHYLQGELIQSEVMFNRSLELNRAGRDEYLMACCYSGLGLVWGSRGDLKRAEEMQKVGLDMMRGLNAGDFRKRDGIARQCYYLANIYIDWGQLDKAEEMCRKALEIHEKIQHWFGMGSDYSAMGTIYYARGKLDEAEGQYRKALEINCMIENCYGMACDYSGLGAVYYVRRDLDKAEEMFNESLKISELRGLMELTARVYINLGLVFTNRGNLDQAKVLFDKSLKISEPKTLRLISAKAYCGLGELYERQRDVIKARYYWSEALEIYREIGMQREVEKVQGWIDELYKKSNSKDQSKE